MSDDTIRETILDLIKQKSLNTEEVLEKTSKIGEKDNILIQLILLEKSSLVERKILDNDDPLMKSEWKTSDKWGRLIEKEKSIIEKKEEKRIKEHMIVATIPPEFSFEKEYSNLIETRDALAMLFSSAQKCIRISTPYLDEILRLFSSILILNAPKDIKIKIMTISQDNPYSEIRLNRLISDLKNRFNNVEFIKFERKNINNQFIFKTHAKVIILDEKYLFITSANLMRTSYLDNFEMGYLTTNIDLIKTSINIFDKLFEEITS